MSVNQVYRLCYAKGEEAKYLSHLDTARMVERAARRAGLPLAFSQGFRHRPLLSFGPPLPVGTSGEDEYLDLELREEVAAPEVGRRLGEMLPSGVRVNGAWTVEKGGPSLIILAGAASYRLDLVEGGSGEPRGREETEGVLSALREEKPSDLLAFSWHGGREKVKLCLALRLGAKGLRPEAVAEVLAPDWRPAGICRTALYWNDGGRWRRIVTIR